MDASLLAAICNFYICIHVCACVCMHAHGCGDTTHAHPDALRHRPTRPSPIPRAAGSPKHQNSISLELIEIMLILFDNISLPLNTPELNIEVIVIYPDTPHPPAPPPRAEANFSTSGRITITCERNKHNWIPIWRFGTLEPYCTRTDCIWCVSGGCPIPKGTFMQKVLLWPSKIFFSCFCTGSH